MARCDRCGAEGLKWETVPPTRGYQLMEPEGGCHVCRPEDKMREYKRRADQMNAAAVVVRKYREENGYL